MVIVVVVNQDLTYPLIKNHAIVLQIKMVTNNLYLKMVNVVFLVNTIVLVAMMVSQLMEELVILMKFVIMVNPLVNLHGNALFLVMLIAQIVIVQ